MPKQYPTNSMRFSNSDLRDRMKADNDKASLAQIAERANVEGLRTTRGGPWRADTVLRALKRLEIDGE
ncbi:hypothetical protein CSE45_3929 [Citreicella sp. SE45]|nr:hypothetical protein CSE45_3929 [Citreicella sp. SE45]